MHVSRQDGRLDRLQLPRDSAASKTASVELEMAGEDDEDGGSCSSDRTACRRKVEVSAVSTSCMRHTGGG